MNAGDAVFGLRPYFPPPKRRRPMKWPRVLREEYRKPQSPLIEWRDSCAYVKILKYVSRKSAAYSELTALVPIEANFSPACWLSRGACSIVASGTLSP